MLLHEMVHVWHDSSWTRRDEMEGVGGSCLACCPYPLITSASCTRVDLGSDSPEAGQEGERPKPKL